MIKVFRRTKGIQVNSKEDKETDKSTVERSDGAEIKKGLSIPYPVTSRLTGTVKRTLRDKSNGIYEQSRFRNSIYGYLLYAFFLVSMEY